MTIATGTAPTESEIRDVVLRRATGSPNDDPRNLLREAVVLWGTVLSETAFEVLEAEDPRDEMLDETGRPKVSDLDLWVDLRATEAVVLRRLTKEAVNRAHERCQAIIVDELVAAAAQFAEECPDAPRAAKDPA